MISSDKILITTEDGSHSIYMPALGENYHSTHGAIQESMHIFIDAGLRETTKTHSNINILEMGFGTGLNALLTYIESRKEPININYTSLEAYPISMEMAEKLNYPAMLEDRKWDIFFKELHSCGWNQKNHFSNTEPHFTFQKNHISLLDFETQEKFDLVYFDAFAPEIQPELWTAEVFEKIFNLMNPGGILVTYCCKGTVKRNMKAAGFSIEKLPGPPGKREMLRSWKSL